jgi:PKD repeat protein
MIPGQNVLITYTAPSCQDGVPCPAAEQIAFNATALAGYNFSCTTHEFSWNFGDGSASSAGQSVSHVYTAAGTYTVTLVISNAVQRVTVTATVLISPGPGCNGLMFPNQNVFILYTGSTSGCSLITNSDCRNGEAIAFQAATFGYTFACAVHTFMWNFGDGSSASSPSVIHSFATAGTYPVTLTIANQSQIVTMTSLVKVGFSDFVLSWDFVAQPYIFNGIAVEHAFTFVATVVPGQVDQWQWDFGDGTRITGGAVQSHVYADGNALHDVSVTIPGVPGSVHHLVGTTKRRASKH